MSDWEEVILSCAHTPCTKGVSVHILKSQNRRDQLAEKLRDGTMGVYRKRDDTYHCKDHTRVVPLPLSKGT